MSIKLSLKKNQYLIGLVLTVIGGIYQVLNVVWWGWWTRDLTPDIWARGAVFNGLTLAQVITRDFGFLAAPLFAVTLILLIAGIALLWIDTST